MIAKLKSVFGRTQRIEAPELRTEVEFLREFVNGRAKAFMVRKAESLRSAIYIKLNQQSGVPIFRTRDVAEKFATDNGTQVVEIDYREAPAVPAILLARGKKPLTLGNITIQGVDWQLQLTLDGRVIDRITGQIEDLQE